MGGRGATSSLKRTPNYREAYNDEVRRGKEFYGDFALENYMTKEAMAYEMKVYKETKGTSLIADLNREISNYKKDLRNNSSVGESYGLDDATIKGIGDGIKENIKRREQAVKVLMSAKGEYNDVTREERIRNQRAQKMKEKGVSWM